MRHRHVQAPWHLPPSTWATIFRRAWREQGQDNIGLAAAGVSVYGLLALVPMLGGLVLSYGLIATPDTVVGNIGHLAKMMPVGAASRAIVRESEERGKKPRRFSPAFDLAR